MNLELDNAREGFRILGGYSYDRYCGPTPIRTVLEIGRVSHTLSQLPAYVYAGAMLAPYGGFNKNPIIRDMQRLGPWSWSSEVWYSDCALVCLEYLPAHVYDEAVSIWNDLQA